ncbi:MAG: SsrA-binding protein SmpB [Alphaproteobacteria bacterium]|jgi:SsrA-binding protein
MAKETLPAGSRMVAQNRKARHNYFIEDSIEAGLVLTGTEVKSLRAGHATLGDAYAVEKGGEMFLVNAHISEYAGGNMENHEPLRARKLLLHKREIARLIDATQRHGMTVVPLSLYFNGRGVAKVNLGIAKGKRQYDKRATVKEREWKRDKARLMKEQG